MKNLFKILNVLCVLFCVFGLFACGDVKQEEIQGLEFYSVSNDAYGVKIGEDSKSFEKIEIPKTYKGYPVVKILDNGFRNSIVKEITIPDCITSIGSYAFYGCSSLTSVKV